MYDQSFSNIESLGNSGADFSNHFFTFGRGGHKWPDVGGAADLVTFDDHDGVNNCAPNTFKTSLGKFKQWRAVLER